MTVLSASLRNHNNNEKKNSSFNKQKTQEVVNQSYQKSIDINQFNLPINNNWFWKSIEIEITEEIIYWLSSVNKINNNH